MIVLAAGGSLEGVAGFRGVDGEFGFGLLRLRSWYTFSGRCSGEVWNFGIKVREKEELGRCIWELCLYRWCWRYRSGWVYEGKECREIEGEEVEDVSSSSVEVVIE